MGYHIKEINKGKYQFSSKIVEEVEELLDAENQGNKIMALIELSDIMGAVEGYLSFRYPGISMEDLLKMARATQKAFKDGSRK